MLMISQITIDFNKNRRKTLKIIKENYNKEELKKMLSELKKANIYYEIWANNEVIITQIAKELSLLTKKLKKLQKGIDNKKEDEYTQYKYNFK